MSILYVSKSAETFKKYVNNIDDVDYSLPLMIILCDVHNNY